METRRDGGVSISYLQEEVMAGAAASRVRRGGRAKVSSSKVKRKKRVSLRSKSKLVRAGTVRKLLPDRFLNSNKTSYGHVLVIGGSKGMEGAAILAATAAARMGAGYVSLCSPKPIDFGKRPPDFLSFPWARIRRGDFGKATAVILGPGLAAEAGVAGLLRDLAKSGLPAVIDAGALDAVAKCRGLEQVNWILTPHAGELARMLGLSSAAAISRDRLGFARKAALRWGACVLLKGPGTLIDDGVRASQISSGNEALAKAGTGDVLAGFIGGLLAQGLSPVEAGQCGAWIHGAIADEWVAQGFGKASLMASDLPERLKDVWRKLGRGR